MHLTGVHKLLRIKELAMTKGLADGMLKHYLTQARASDRNVETRLEREPFDYREYMKALDEKYPSMLTAAARQKRASRE
jgi:hypothetical protein